MIWREELLGLFGLSKKSLMQRWADRFLRAVEQAAGSLEGARDRASEVARTAHERAGTRLAEVGEHARAGTRAGRDLVSETVDAINRRATEMRERRQRRREARQQGLQERRARRPRGPMRIDLRRADRIVLRGRRPVDLRMLGGGKIRYRYYERPSFPFRVYLHLTGRKVWPPR
jgi:hypothetical protein